MPAGRSNWWTPEREAWLRENARGNPASWLARQLGCTRNAVIGKAHRLGLEMTLPNERTPEQRREIRLDYLRARYWANKAMTPPVPKPKPAPPAPYAPAGGVSILDLGNHSCRWPITSGRPPYLYCGQVSAAGSSYCPHHWGVSRGREARRWT